MKDFYTFLSKSMLRLIMIVLFHTLAQVMSAQEATDPQSAEKKESKVKVSGSLGLSQDFFKYTTNDLLYQPYRPKSVTRFYGSTALSYGRFSLPFSISISTQAGGNTFSSPIPQKFKFRDLLSNYNQLSFSPKIGSFQALLGTQIPQYSELTSGDLPIFGGGFAWSPRKFRVALFYGMSQRGVSYDTLNRNLGSYKRMSMTGKLGFGHEDSSHIYLIANRHIDDKNSAIVSPEGDRPQENVVSSLDWKVILFKKFFIQNEIAVSALSRDINDATLESDSFKLNVPRQLIQFYTPRLSTTVGAAGTGSIGYNGQNWGFRALARLYSPGYKTLNYPFLQSDRLEWLVEPRMALFKGKFSLTGSVGTRRDNLWKNKIATAYQTLGSANVNMMLTPNWSINGNYSNYGMRNTLSNDTFRIQNVNQNLSVSSNHTFLGEKTMHSVILAYNQNQFQDYNIVSGFLSDNDSKMYMLTYNLGFASSPLTVTAVGTHFENTISVGTTKSDMASLQLGYALGKQKQCTVSVQGNIMRTTLLEYTPDDNITTTLSVNYTFKKLNLGMNGNLNLYRYGTAKPGINYQENSLRTFAMYSF